MDVQPFVVNLRDRDLDDLRERLRRTRWPDEIEDAGWDYGSNLGYVRELCAYWAERFDWRAQEERINRFPQFRTEMEGLGIHFVHVRGTGPAPRPLLITHGWPSTFVELLPIVPLLADPGSHGGDPADAFDVVVPSMPGYGFSRPPGAARHEPGPGRRPVARADDRGAGLRPLLCPGRRLGRADHRGARVGVPRPGARHPPDHGGRDRAGAAAVGAVRRRAGVSAPPRLVAARRGRLRPPARHQAPRPWRTG